MELCDLVDGAGLPIGRTVPRGSLLGPGEYYLVVHVWIRDEAGNYLIQQRALDRPTDPGVWATTAGFVQAGEDSLAGALREAREELTLQLAPDQLRRLERHTLGNRVEDIWLAEVARQSLGPPSAGPEVADWQWAPRAALIALAGRGAFFSYSYLNRLPG